MSVETLGHVAALGCAATWALATLLYGRAAQTVDARALNLWKCALSTALLGVTALVVRDVPVLSSRDSIALFVSAVLGLVIADTAYFIALRHLGAARGVLFVSLVPVSTALLAVPVLDEALTLRMLAGMALTICGVTIVVRTRVASSVAAPSPVPDASVAASAGTSASTSAGVPASAPAVRSSARSTRIGVIAGVVYCVAQAGANVLTKGTDASLSPLTLSVVRLAIGTLILGAMLGATSTGRAHVRALGPVLKSTAIATGIGTYVGLLLGTFALRTVSAGVATTLIATTPLFALVLSRIVTGETPPPRAMLGAVLALVGVALLLA